MKHLFILLVTMSFMINMSFAEEVSTETCDQKLESDSRHNPKSDVYISSSQEETKENTGSSASGI